MMNRQGRGKKAMRGGKPHNKKPMYVNSGQDPYSCPGCNFTSSAPQNLRVHLRNTNHDGKSKNSQRGPGVDEADDTAGVIPDHIKRAVFILKDYMQLSDREPVIGIEYVLEYRLQAAPDQTRLRYFCQLCEADLELVPMMEHLSCYRHRKLYLIKAFPYVLRAPSNAKENRAQFMRRMAAEIEREEGRKTYTMDPVLRTEPMKSADAKQSKIKTRWNYEGDQQKRMRKAVEYLETFEIDNDTEASTVNRLTEKLIAELKYHSDKLKEEALFPAKVARAKDVAMSIMQNAPRKPMPPKNQRNPVQKAPPVFDKAPPVFDKGPPMFNKGPPENINMGRPSGPPQPNPNENPSWAPNPHENPSWAPNRDNPSWAPNRDNPSWPPNRDNPSWPPNRDNPSWPPNAAFPHRGHDAENIPREPIAQPNPPPLQSEQPNEDNKFVKKLKLLLSVLQQNSASADGTQMNSKLMMLKSLLQNKAGNTPANQLPMQMGPMTPDMASAENVALYQQLQLMAAKNPAAMAQFGPNIMMQMAGMVNNAAPMENAQVDQNSIMQMAAQLQNNQMNANAFLPENREFVPEYGNMNPMMPMDPTAYQNQYVEQQQGFPNTFQSNEGYGYDGQMAGNNTMRPYGDFSAKEAPYTRVTLSPSNQRAEPERFRDDGYARDLRRDVRSHETRPSYGERRPLDDPAWADRDSDMHYGKRSRQDNERMRSHSADRGRHYPDEGGAAGASTPNLSVDLLKRIRGKDLFTVSAILSEYAENPSTR